MSHAPASSLDTRHLRLRQQLKERSLDALIVTSIPNIVYLSNFTGSSAIVVLTRDALIFVTDFRYVTAVESGQRGSTACPGLRLEVVDGSYDDTLAAVVARFNGARVGFEAGHLTVARFDWLVKKLAAVSHAPALVPTEGIVEEARIIKDAYEIGVLREAGRRLSLVARDVVTAPRVGMTERELGRIIDGRLRDGGFERNAFETIVASGPNGALPHARPSERKLREGDLVVLDFGGVYDSYCVDLTRTISLGAAGERARAVHEAVRDAHDRAIGAVQPGTLASDVDQAARRWLTEQGLGEAFGHGTGHGLGIEVHETPRVTKRRPDGHGDVALAAGMVFTIEPGAYLPEWGGVRIEDDVCVTETGAALLTDVPTVLLEV